MLRDSVAALLLLLGSCWRGSAAPSDEPQPFVARINAVAELRAAADALPPRLDIVAQRIAGLASEAERDAVRQDLVELDRDVATLWRYALSLRQQGADPVTLDAITRKLARAADAVSDLRDELVYAKTVAEQQALDEQGRDKDDPAAAPRRTLVRHLLDGDEPLLVPDPALRVPASGRPVMRLYRARRSSVDDVLAP